IARRGRAGPVPFDPGAGTGRIRARAGGGAGDVRGGTRGEPVRADDAAGGGAGTRRLAATRSAAQGGAGGFMKLQHAPLRCAPGRGYTGRVNRNRAPLPPSAACRVSVPPSNRAQRSASASPNPTPPAVTSAPRPRQNG